MAWDELGEPRDPRPWTRAAVAGATVDDLEAFVGPLADAPVVITIVGDRERVGLEAQAKIGTVHEVQAEDLFGYGPFPPVAEDEKESPREH